MSGRSVVAAFILFLVGLVSTAAAVAAGADDFFDPTFGDLRGELDAARNARKQGVLLMFEMEGCPYCRRMRQTVLNRRDVQAYFHERFLVFTVDTRGAIPLSDFSGAATTERAFSVAQQVSGTPTFLFVAPDGREMARYVGATRDAAMFLQLGRYVADGYYRQQDFASFLKLQNGQ